MRLHSLFRSELYANIAQIAALLLSLSLLSANTYGQQQNPLSHSKSSENRFKYETWVTDMSNRMARYIKNPQKRLALLKRIQSEAKRVNLKPELILAIIQTESAFDRFAVSSAGAQGLMQVMPFWKEEIGYPQDNLINIDTNLRYGCTILSHYLSVEKGNLTRALARYNGSLGKYHYPEKVYTNWETYWQ